MSTVDILDVGARLARPRVARHPGRHAGKRVFDVVGALVLLLLSLLVLVPAAALIWLHDRGPVLFVQERVGFGGRTFRLLKLRTMRVGSEVEQSALVHANAADGLLFKVPGDPRITPVGRVLRHLSIDELPQLWNVLRGEMSLVGPRPLAVAADAFAEREARRHDTRPGLTGPWQVAGGSGLPWSTMVEIDLAYIDEWRFTRDLAVIARTPLALVRGTGA